MRCFVKRKVGIQAEQALKPRARRLLALWQKSLKPDRARGKAAHAGKRYKSAWPGDRNDDKALGSHRLHHAMPWITDGRRSGVADQGASTTLAQMLENVRDRLCFAMLLDA